MTSFRRVTVVGGSGFIGRYVVKRLARQGARITVVGRYASHARFLQPMGDVGQIVQIDAALDDDDALRQVVEGADAVINLVGILAEHGSQRFDAVQHQGAARLAGIAASAEVRQFVQVSAIGADPASHSHYAKSKGLAEAAVRAAFPAATILRPSIVFGAEDQFFNRFARMARLVPVLPLIGGGHTLYQPIYVDDVAAAVLACLDEPQAAGRTYELGGPEVLSFRQLMTLLIRTIERPATRLVGLPFGLANLLAALTGWLPGAPLTRDQVLLLRHDNVVAPDALGLGDLGIAPTACEALLEAYLARYRPASRQ